ncbi:hypothetical protein HYPSUDRAFT_130715, partial [Hypholoma sublateritium FD-334 SS-4]
VYVEKQQAVEAPNDALLFNCAQRIISTLELIPIVYVMTILGGLSFPVFSAFTCTCWNIECILILGLLHSRKIHNWRSQKCMPFATTRLFSSESQMTLIECSISLSFFIKWPTS